MRSPWVKPDLGETDKASEILERVTPHHMRLLLDRDQATYVGTAISAEWHLPTFIENVFVFYLNDFSSGVVLRVSIDAEFEMQVTAVGSGIGGL